MIFPLVGSEPNLDPKSEDVVFVFCRCSNNQIAINPGTHLLFVVVV